MVQGPSTEKKIPSKGKNQGGLSVKKLVPPAISMSKCCLGLVSHPSCLHTGWKEAVPRNDSSHLQEESPFENAYFFLSDEYRGSLIKQVTYMQLKSSEEIFLYVYPKYRTRPCV